MERQLETEGGRRVSHQSHRITFTEGRYIGRPVIEITIHVGGVEVHSSQLFGRLTKPSDKRRAVIHAANEYERAACAALDGPNGGPGVLVDGAPSESEKVRL
jgi:hypothetical protein